mmetsp:Transcript_6886/g.16890  ORF Transcript_6886/g.16890 Transcript_6886/m.16890 type:complete len:223 (-) Transcript_6886:293-961(-)
MKILDSGRSSDVPWVPSVHHQAPVRREDRSTHLVVAHFFPVVVDHDLRVVQHLDLDIVPRLQRKLLGRIAAVVTVCGGGGANVQLGGTRVGPDARHALSEITAVVSICGEVQNRSPSVDLLIKLNLEGKLVAGDGLDASEEKVLLESVLLAVQHVVSVEERGGVFKSSVLEILDKSSNISLPESVLIAVQNVISADMLESRFFKNRSCALSGTLFCQESGFF